MTQGLSSPTPPQASFWHTSAPNQLQLPLLCGLEDHTLFHHAKCKQETSPGMCTQNLETSCSLDAARSWTGTMLISDIEKKVKSSNKL